MCEIEYFSESDNICENTRTSDSESSYDDETAIEIENRTDSLSKVGESAQRDRVMIHEIVNRRDVVTLLDSGCWTETICILENENRAESEFAPFDFENSTEIEFQFDLGKCIDSPSKHDIE